MIQFKKQIQDTFFNPIIHFIPLLIILVGDEFVGMKITASIAFPLGFIVLLYLYFFHRRTFGWHLFFSSLLMTVSLLVAVLSSNIIPAHLPNLLGELFCLFFLFFFIVFRPWIEYFIQNSIENKLPMLNNTDEMYRVIWSLFYLLLFYVSMYSLLNALDSYMAVQYAGILRYTYAGITTLVVIYEILRIQIIRSKLFEEDWWPIVNEQGKIIGSVQSNVSIGQKFKYIHPVVRVLIINNGMIFLQKRHVDDVMSPGMWDTSIISHVKVGESLELCVDRSAKSMYGLDNFRYLFLSKYNHKTTRHSHYAFLFVSCKSSDLHLDSGLAETTKWWTEQQIEDNIDAGIFSEEFLKDYSLLKHSGLLEQQVCQCKCRLKDTVFGQLYVHRKRTN